MSTHTTLTRAAVGAAIALLMASAACSNDKKPPKQPAVKAADAGLKVTLPKKSHADAGLSAPKTPARAMSAACAIKVTAQGDAQIDGKPLGIKLTASPEGRRAGIRAFPFTDKAVLVAVQHNWLDQSGETTPTGKLWEVPCKDPSAKKLFLDLEGADFGNAAMPRKGPQLYFTGPHGIAILELDTKKWRSITEPPELPKTCWPTPDKPLKARDIVSSRTVAGNKLVFQRGGPCGHKGAWILEELHLIRPTQPKLREIRIPKPVSAVALDAEERVWLGDAGRCTIPGVHDPQSPGAIWFSDDHGDTWDKLAIEEKGKPARTAVKAIFSDPRTKGHTIAFTARCQTPNGTTGGSIYKTTDKGKTWTRLTLPKELKVTDKGQGLHAMNIVEGNLDHIVIWERPHKRWETKDSGKTWASINAGRMPRNQARLAKNESWIFRASSNGLLRKNSQNKRLRRVYPPNPDTKKTP